MALWGTHVAIGGLGALAVVWAFRPDLRYARVVVGSSGPWAIVPDAHRVYPPLRAVTKPAAARCAASPPRRAWVARSAELR